MVREVGGEYQEAGGEDWRKWTVKRSRGPSSLLLIMVRRVEGEDQVAVGEDEVGVRQGKGVEFHHHCY